MTRPAEPKQMAIDNIERSSISGTKLRQASRCRTIAELGQGGMATVYLAVNQGQGGVNKLVVFKALRPEFASDPDVLAMFLDEARVAARLNHPNVVQTYEVGYHEGASVLIMEYLEGQPFSRLLRESERAGRKLSLRVALRIICSVLEGLHYVHELQGFDGKPLELVHRDISPQNVFVTYDGQVKILDFGIAKAKDSYSHTAIGMVKGKIAYMAPEQMSCGRVDRRADIYAVGCMLWAIATGKRLWHGLPDMHVMTRVLSGDIPSPTTGNPHVDPRFASIVCKAMAAKLEDRYQTALELQSDLEAYCDQLGAVVRQSEIGAVVNELFATTRAQIRSVIESQLASLDGDHSLPQIQLAEELSGPISGRRPTEPRVKTLAAQAPPPPRRRLLSVMVAVVVVAALVYAGSWLRPHGARAQREVPTSPVRQEAAALVSELASAPSALATSPSASVSAVAPALATIQFEIEPADARLFLDGIALPAEAKSRVLPADGSRHTLRAEAPRFHPGELEFVVTRDTSLELSLSKLGSPTRKAAPSKPQKAPANSAPSAAAPAPPAAAAAPAACSDPFFIAEGGIKRIRPECL